MASKEHPADMNTEIEYKFLVDSEAWNQVDKPEPKLIIQAYLQREKERTVRVRVKGDKGYLTIKGETIGVTRSEFEYEIPVHEAQAMIDHFDLPSIRKHRYELEYAGKIWEVDVFGGKLEGLILAEIELSSEDEAFEKPPWVTEDVSSDPSYYNSQLINRLE